MNLKDIENKSELISKIGDLTNDISEYLKSLAKDDINQKRAALIYYWLRDYKNYLKNEINFNSEYTVPFIRGNIVNVNLGFNLGSELGGLHYCIVLRDSPAKNPNLIVIPMFSLKPHKNEKLRDSQIYIGQELYMQLHAKFNALHQSITEQLKFLNGLDYNNPAIDQRIEHLSEQLDTNSKVVKKLDKLKKGSIIECNQIRVISKMRVVDPQNENDALYGIKLSAITLNKIDKKIIELYTKLELTRG